MLRAKYIAILLASLGLPGSAPASIALGPLYHLFDLTLHPGSRQEALGPLFYHQDQNGTDTWAAPPLFSYTLNTSTDFAELDLVYPIIGFDRFGAEYRFHIFQVFNFAGGQSSTDTNTHRFSLFPIYFQQRSANPEKNYHALVPLAGHLEGRFFRDEVTFVLMPLFVKSRKKDVVTYNMPYPIFHLRKGNGLTGWQVWPLLGHETKEITSQTNMWNEISTVGGHNKFFALWPIFFNEQRGIGTENPEHALAILPLFSSLKSPQRDSFTAPWPIGFTITHDRAKKYKEWGAPWPLIVFARGEGKTTSRIWPLFSRNRNAQIEKNWYLWPIYKQDKIDSTPLARRRTRILFFLYSDLVERNTDLDTALHRVDFWPLFTWRKDHEGRQRLQILSILEPLLPGNKSIERNYSPLWSLWRSEQNPTTQATSQSLLWNLYRRDTSPKSKKTSLLFGLFQYQSSLEGKRWKLFHIPIGKKKNEPSPP